MSMFEALRGIPDKVREWAGQAPAIESPELPPTPQEDAEGLSALARRRGTVDRASGTWLGVSGFAAGEIIAAHAALETASGDQVTRLQSRIRTLRDVLKCDTPAPQIQEYGAERPQ